MSTNIEAALHRVDNGTASVRTKKPIKRNRESLACSSCRIRKLRCDKGHPCASCIRRNEKESCVYRGAKDATGDLTVPDRRVGAEGKLERLETLVKQLVESRNKFFSGKHPPSELVSHSQLPPVAPGHAELLDSDIEEENGPMYIGSTNWSTMLDDIKELKEIIRNQEDDVESEDQCFGNLSTEFASLFGAEQYSTVQMVLAQHLPPKAECDRSLSTYFRAKAIAGPFIHRPQFMRQYLDFWKNPLESPPLWISMLFSILHLSTKVDVVNHPDVYRAGNTQVRSRRFLVAAARCLTLGKYYQPKRFSVEALTLHIQCKVTAQLDTCSENGVILGTLVQLAHILGYHRDPDHLRNATPFEKEMRRRTWAVCMQMDLLVSFQLGIPCNVQVGTWDTKLPINLLDSDFDEDTKEMPVPRPDTESTMILFSIAKQKLMIAFERVLRHSLASVYSGEDEVMMLDCEIRETYLGLPKLMRERTVPEFIAEDPYLISTRHCVEFIYQKSLCVLHRKYVSRGRKESVKACYDAASTMVKRFLVMYREFKPGGHLYSDRWLLSSVIWNDFLMSVLVLCLVLKSRHDKELSPETQERVQVITDLLKMSWTICLENHTASRGARKVCTLLHSILTSNDDNFASNSGDEDASDSTSRPEVLLATSSSLVSPVAHRQHQHENVLETELGQQSSASDVGDPLANMDWSEDFLNAMADDEWNAIQQYLDLPGTFPYDEQLPG